MATFEKLFNEVTKLNNNQIVLYDTEAIVLEQKMIEDSVNLSGLTVIIDLRTRGERDEPHFHVYVDGARNTKDGSKRKTFHSCVRLDIPEYFDHGTKTGKFNVQEIKDLIHVLNSKYYKDPRYTVWSAMCLIWNNIPNRKYILPKDLEMPDYTKLK